MAQQINELFLKLAKHIGEGELLEAEEIRIIDIEERYRECGGVPIKDLLWLKKLLSRLSS
ncbi:MAG: hypothetical protein GWN93_24965 [Deltaproteobacteria bacterium]|nr:hypothetical protein [Deltaproteobacteria bacterium]